MSPNGVSISTVSATATTGNASSADVANAPSMVRVRIAKLHSLLMDIFSVSRLIWLNFEGDAIYQTCKKDQGLQLIEIS
jgi:hypothetical protein